MRNAQQSTTHAQPLDVYDSSCSGYMWLGHLKHLAYRTQMCSLLIVTLIVLSITGRVPLVWIYIRPRAYRL